MLATQRICPESKIRKAKPASLLRAMEDFRNQLPYAQKEIVRHAIPRAPDGTPQRCAGNRACQANAELDAIWKAGLIDEFAQAACARGAAPWR